MMTITTAPLLSELKKSDNGSDNVKLLAKIDEAGIGQTPYMLTDLDVIKDKCNIFRREFPDLHLYYAMKAFSDNEVISAVDPLVDGYDAASIAEIRQLVGLGIDPTRIAFSNPVKPEIDIRDAALLGVKKFAFQSYDELTKLARHAPGAKVYVRVKMDDTHSAVPLSGKYGCPSGEAVELLLSAKKMKLKPIGINFHIGSQQTGFAAWGKAIERSQQLIKEARSRGVEVSLINVGGGFPAQYLPGDPGIKSVSMAINPYLDMSMKDVSYMAEPGRFIVAESSVIVSSVISIEERDGATWAYMDVGMFQAFLGAQRFEPFPYPPISYRHLIAREQKTTKKFIITGPSCDSHDIICSNAILPTDLRVGDKLIFPNTGAYTVVYGSSFNGFPVPKRYFIGNA